jgi:hypothetical protein
MFTVGETARLISAENKVSEAMVARILRDWLQKGLLSPTLRRERGTKGKIKAAYFDELGVCRVRILFAIWSIGSAPSVLRDLNRHLRSSSLAPKKLSISEAVKAIEKDADETWTLRVSIVRDYLDRDGEDSIARASATWLVNGNSFDRPSVLELGTDVIGAITEAEIIIPVSKILPPLIKAMRG